MNKPSLKASNSPRVRVALVLLALAAMALAGGPLVRSVLVGFDLRKARIALDAAEPEQALDWLMAAEKRQPDRGEIHYLLAVTHRRLAQYEPAEEHLRRLDAMKWSRKDVQRQRVMIEFQNGDIARTEPVLIKMLQQGGSDEVAEEIYEALAIGYAAEHRPQEAHLCLDHWLEWRPDSLRARMLKALLYSRGMNAKKLQAELREVLRIAPERLNERLALAGSLLETTQSKESLAECEICLRQAPDDPRVLLAIGCARYRLGQGAEAKGELERAVQADLNPDQLARGFTMLGQIASAEGDGESAVRYHEKAVKLSPLSPSANYGLGTALTMLGRDEEAKGYLKEWESLGKQSNRLAEITLELTKEPNDAALRVEAANILLAQGSQVDAANWMISALYCDPTLRVAHELLADFCE
ncbi:MAG TPA: tetratricopeptide repeat protein, partial [Pirellulales bacterium]|nr:tetratricopeptide repeat protein [Pirellulales bacterium]